MVVVTKLTRTCVVIYVGWLLASFASDGKLAASPTLPTADPDTVGMSADRLARIDDVVAEGLRRKRLPGCVVLVGRKGKIVHFKAYGYRELLPNKVPMTTDTVFDLASLTKPIATATSVMTLVEQGKVSLSDTVAKYIPEFGSSGKQEITVEQLLTHQGGLIPDNALRDYDNGQETAWKNIFDLKLYVDPGTKFVYSDVGFIVLAKLVERVTGKNIHQYSTDAIFKPLGMNETGFLPSAELRKRAAVTEQREKRWMRGEVHDPRAYRLGGIAGHAGLFSTADDLALYAQMLLQTGELNGSRAMKTGTVALMIKPVEVSSGLRGLGWDIRTGYSTNRGDLFSKQAFGHGGFTGTSLWIDPKLNLFVIFLSNRVHPDGKGSVNSLAGRIGTIAAAAVHELNNSNE
jgi:CubicO group peptidase (beta-lactamase class C family)